MIIPNLIITFLASVSLTISTNFNENTQIQDPLTYMTKYIKYDNTYETNVDDKTNNQGSKSTRLGGDQLYYDRSKSSYNVGASEDCEEYYQVTAEYANRDIGYQNFEEQPKATAGCTNRDNGYKSGDGEEYPKYQVIFPGENQSQNYFIPKIELRNGIIEASTKAPNKPKSYYVRYQLPEVARVQTVNNGCGTKTEKKSKKRGNRKVEIRKRRKINRKNKEHSKQEDSIRESRRNMKNRKNKLNDDGNEKYRDEQKHEYSEKRRKGSHHKHERKDGHKNRRYRQNFKRRSSSGKHQERTRTRRDHHHHHHHHHHHS